MIFGVAKESVCRTFDCEASYKQQIGYKLRFSFQFDEVMRTRIHEERANAHLA